MGPDSEGPYPEIDSECIRVLGTIVKEGPVALVEWLGCQVPIDLLGGREESGFNPFSPSLAHSTACSPLIELGAGAGGYPNDEEGGRIEFYHTLSSLPSLPPTPSSLGCKLVVALETGHMRGDWVNPLTLPLWLQQKFVGHIWSPNVF